MLERLERLEEEEEEDDDDEDEEDAELPLRTIICTLFTDNRSRVSLTLGALAAARGRRPHKVMES